MANTPQAKKRIRRNARRNEINGNRVSRIRTFVKKVEAALEAGDKAAATAALSAAQPELARGVAKGVLHKNMASRKFSRLTNDQKQALRGELDAKIPVTDLAKKYGVSRRTIYNLKNRWEERLPQSRSKVLTVRVSAEDMERLDAMAKELDLSRADTARRVLLYAAGIYHMGKRLA